jgi:hypothetical protein
MKGKKLNILICSGFFFFFFFFFRGGVINIFLFICPGGRGAKFQYFVIKKRAVNPTKDFLGNDCTNSPYFEEEKVQFVRFRP